MEFRQLQALAAIARTGSFIRAAQELGYAQSTITAQIQGLEAELGVRLFERLGRKVRPTNQGRTLLPYAEQILQLAARGQEAVRDTGEPRGRLVIGSGESLSTYRLPPLLQHFRTCHPQVEIALKFSNCSSLRELIGRNEVDVGLLIDRKVTDPGLCAEILSREKLVFLVAPGHPLAAAKGVTPPALAGLGVILTEPGCSFRQTFETLLREAGVVPHSVLEVSSIESIKQFAALGLGVAMLPRFAAAGELAGNRLAALDWGGPEPEYYVQAIYHKDKWLSPTLQAFLTAVRQVLAGKRPE
ncbi:MAG TPA: LysR family transcriptional regulator [Selenomonadales bacterium]|nr:LysR family transcriptional regulator [Selenomonadales bacterium]